MPNSAIKRQKRLLCVGCNWVHKNIHELLKFHDLWMPDYQLDIVMSQTSYTDYLKEIVKSSNLGKSVVFHHGVADVILKKMYLESSALIYPSLDEGFGIPPLEAMSFGLPVIASDIPVFRELFNEAPIYVKLGDRESWSQAFQKLSKSPLLDAHVSYGREIAKTFTLEKMAAELELVIAKVWPELCRNTPHPSSTSRSIA